jgi:uncharacterized membrane protein
MEPLTFFVILFGSSVMAGALGALLGLGGGVIIVPILTLMPGLSILAFHQRSGPGFFPTSFQAVVSGAVIGKPYAIICLGMLLLALTPVVRVALSVIFFLVQRDWLYVGITLFVLAVLTLSLSTGIG